MTRDKLILEKALMVIWLVMFFVSAVRGNDVPAGTALVLSQLMGCYIGLVRKIERRFQPPSP